MTDLLERLDELGRSAVAAVVSPPMEAIVARADRRRRTRRRRSMLGAAALVAAVAIVGGVLATTSTHHTRVTTTDEQDHGEAPHLVPSVWPAGLDAPTTTSGGQPWSPRSMPAWILAHDGRATVRVAIDPQPLVTLEDSTGSPEWERISIAGHPGWAHADGLDERVELAVHPGWTLEVASRSADRATLERLAATFDPAHDRLRAGRLPAGWSIVDLPDGLASLLEGGSGLTGPNWSSASRTSTDVLKSLTVSSTRTDHAAKVIDTLRQLYGTDSSVDLGLGGVNLHVGLRSLVVWAPSKDVLAVGSGMASDDQFLASLRSARPLTDQEWSTLEADRRHDVDGFAIHDGERVVAHGSVDRWKWMVTTAPSQLDTLPSEIPRSIIPQLVPTVHVRTPDGSQSEYGGSLSVGTTGYGRDDQLVQLEFGAPSGIHDAQIEYDGKRIPTVAVPIPALDVTLVFGFLPARETREVDQALATLATTLADGSNFAPPKPNGG